jgi:hypothetical protein
MGAVAQSGDRAAWPFAGLWQLMAQRRRIAAMIADGRHRRKWRISIDIIDTTAAFSVAPAMRLIVEAFPTKNNFCLVDYGQPKAVFRGGDALIEIRCYRTRSLAS